MTPKPLGPTRAALVARGFAAALALIAAAATSVAYGSGAFDRDPLLYTVIPASSGLLIGEIGVQYHGVQVGTVVDIDSGVDSSLVSMRVEPGTVPASAQVRVVPRTLFGDVYLRLVDTGEGRTPATSGDSLAVDTSADAVQLSEVYRKVTTLLDRLEPAKAQAALTAIDTALDGKGEQLGATTDRLASLTEALEPRTGAVLDALPRTAQVTDALAAATPDVIAAIDAATRLSRTALDKSSGVESLLAAAASLGSSAAEVGEENRAASITVIRRGAPALATVAENSSGVSATLDRFEPFGAAGARIFATGRFDITAVPDFSSPLPYTPADCPRYPGLDGPNCGLAEVQETVTGTPGPLNAASTMLLAPLLRGTEVAIR